jgi:acetate kinase
MKVLVLNCGSSSIKYQLYEMPEIKVLAKGRVEKINEEGANLEQQSNGQTVTVVRPVADHEAAMHLVLETLVQSEAAPLQSVDDIDAVGHRVVHGGEEFTGSVLIDDHVLDSIQRFADLAPLHNPANLTGIRVAQKVLNDAPQIACFDTAFHTTIPPVAFTYALPYGLYEKYGVRRYGFHGTSHRWVARRAAAMLDRQKYDINCITCHLGNGCSITAVKDGRSVDTSMGLTPLEGVVMGTRSGDFDPAILFYLADKGYDVTTLNQMCNKESGLLGISGVSNDMRILTEEADRGNERARLAVDIFCYRIKKYIGMYLAVLGRVDALVFTGGIGENAAGIRAQTCGGLEEIGLDLDPERNSKAIGCEADISYPDSRIKVFVIPTDEEAAIACDTCEIASGVGDPV